VGKGKRGSGAGGLVVPRRFVLRQRSAGDPARYFNGLGTSLPSTPSPGCAVRVDGQLVSMAFKEGQVSFTKEIFSAQDRSAVRFRKVQLEQAPGQLAKDQAQRKDAEVNFERYKLLFKEGVIPQQQLDTQGALVGQVDGAITSDQKPD